MGKPLGRTDCAEIEGYVEAQNFICSQRLLAALIAHHSEPVKEFIPPPPYRSIEPEWWPSMWFGDLVSSCKVGGATVGYVQDIVAKDYGVTRIDLISKKRIHAYVLPRQIAMYFARTLLDRPFPDIGRRFGDRDHTTVIHAVQKITARCVSDPEFAKKIAALKAEIMS